MWPTRNEGEDARLYKAVKGASDFAIALGINIPTGKDSMSMTQKYPSGEKVISPGTLIVSTVGQVSDITKTIHASFESVNSQILYIPFDRQPAFNLGGSAYAQVCSSVGAACPDIKDPAYFARCFEAIQSLVGQELILAGHDVSAGGLVTALLESMFANAKGGLDINLAGLDANVLLSELPGMIVQYNNPFVEDYLAGQNVKFYNIGSWNGGRTLDIKYYGGELHLDIDAMRQRWFETSYLLDKRQTAGWCARQRRDNFAGQPLVYRFPEQRAERVQGGKKPVAAIIREKGSNGDREMAWALYMAGFDVKDVHTTDLTSGREDLSEVNMIVFVGGFSNADTLGSAKGWAGALMYNDKARAAIDAFYARKDTLSLGICNGCQLMAELGVVSPDDRARAPKMVHNDSHKFESCFVGVTIEDSPAIMLKSLQGSKLGIWVAHGEGKFSFPAGRNVEVAVRY
ncbi:MAG: phosphoribosylformylglycinamidine synthase subunit PurQ, partial [Bacteroidales bacterium]|nr:phosphoribosylformylglycinamidine synthase subunit PurQ [Bacteroidales bacterium]